MSLGRLALLVDGRVLRQVFLLRARDGRLVGPGLERFDRGTLQRCWRLRACLGVRIRASGLCTRHLDCSARVDTVARRHDGAIGDAVQLKVAEIVEIGNLQVCNTCSARLVDMDTVPTQELSMILTYHLTSHGKTGT